MSRLPRQNLDLTFRLLGYGGLAMIAMASLAAGGPGRLWLLLGFTLIWPPVWWWLIRRNPRLRSPQTLASQLAHAAECLLVMILVVLAGFEVWLVIAIGLLVLTGVSALGGWRLLAPAAPLVALVLIAQNRGLAGRGVDPEILASGMLVASFLLGLALVSFERVRTLDDRRRLAHSESVALRHRNARLARYLPEDLEGLIGERPASLNRPKEAFATVAFVDVVGFVALVASRPVAELVDVLNDFISTMTALTERRGGILSKFLGDGVLIYFPEGAADSPDDRWQAAVSCARLCLELGPALTALAVTWRRRGLSVDLHARVGIASGYCAIGDWGGGARLDYTLIGTPVNLASRLQAEAAPGSVLLTAASAVLIGEDSGLGQSLGNGRVMQIKGFGACMVHELTASANVPASRQSVSNDRQGTNLSGQDIPQSL